MRDKEALEAVQVTLNCLVPELSLMGMHLDLDGGGCAPRKPARRPVHLLHRPLHGDHREVPAPDHAKFDTCHLTNKTQISSDVSEGSPLMVRIRNTHLLRWMCMRTAAWITTAADLLWASSLRSWWPLTCLHQCTEFHWDVTGTSWYRI